VWDRMQSLEIALKSCREELKAEKTKMEELKHDFKYNLKLIDDRDAELQRYDALFLGKLPLSLVVIICFDAPFCQPVDGVVDRRLIWSAAGVDYV